MDRIKKIILAILFLLVSLGAIAGLFDTGIDIDIGSRKTINYMLLEDNSSFLLLESGDKLILEQIL